MRRIVNWLSQVGAVTKFGLLSIPQRGGSVGAAVFGIGGVVAVLVGVLASAAIGFGCPYATFVLKGSYVDLDFSTPGAIFLLFLLTALVNNNLARLNRRWALTPGRAAWRTFIWP